MTDLTLFPEYPNLVKIPLVEEEKTVFYISDAYPNEGELQALLSSFIEQIESFLNKMRLVEKGNS